MSFKSFGSVQIKQPDKCINEIIIEIYSDNGEYGGAVQINDENIPYLDRKLELYFPNYKGFEDFYNAVIKMKKGIDQFRNKYNIGD